jgi:GH25 family lysozyme M1 (1,4-beta-N-acetylmuramidase)
MKHSISTKKKSGKIKIIIIVAISILLACAVAFAGVVVYDKYFYYQPTERDNHMQVATEAAQKNEKILIRTDADADPVYINAIEGMPKNCYDDNSFFTNSYGFKAYKDNDSTISTVGIDVSYVQGDIDWEMVKSSGVDYAIIRCGGRGYGESGILYEDEKFEQNIQGAIDAGLDVGVYFYSQAISVEEAKEEAEYTLKLIKNYDIKYPVVFDWEHYEYEDARTDDVDRETLTSIAKQYCSVVDKAGYTPVIYANRSILYFEYDLAALSDIELWLASYEDVPDFYYDFGMWQYSTDGTIDGIDGTVDLNICMYNY